VFGVICSVIDDMIWLAVNMACFVVDAIRLAVDAVHSAFDIYAIIHVFEMDVLLRVHTSHLYIYACIITWKAYSMIYAG
jgi:hypothetical protein